MKPLAWAVPVAAVLLASPAWAGDPMTPTSGGTQEPAQSSAPNMSSAEATSPDATATEANSPGLVVAGVVVGGVGVGAFAIGAAVLGATDTCFCAQGDDTCERTGCYVAVSSAFAGPILVLGAIPMIVAGAWQIPSDERGIPATTAEVRVGPGTTSLAVTF